MWAFSWAWPAYPRHVCHPKRQERWPAQYLTAIARSHCAGTCRRRPCRTAPPDVARLSLFWGRGRAGLVRRRHHNLAPRQAIERMMAASDEVVDHPLAVGLLRHLFCGKSIRTVGVNPSQETVRSPSSNVAIAVLRYLSAPRCRCGCTFGYGECHRPSARATAPES